MIPHQIKTIVAGVDFSDNSETVIHFASQLATLLDARLKVVHVYEAFGDAGRSSLDESAKHATTLRLSALVDRVCGDGSVRAEPVVLAATRSTTDSLTEASLGADLLVLGKTSSQGLWRLFKGDSIRAVIDRTRCPLIVVPSGYEYQEPQTLSIALGDALPSAAAAQVVLTIAEAADARLLVQHLTTQPDATAAERVEHRFPGCIYTHAYGQNVYSAATRYADEAQTQPGTWLCISHHGHVTWLVGLRDDLADRVATKTQVPVLIMIEPLAADSPPLEPASSEWNIANSLTF